MKNEIFAFLRDLQQNNHKEWMDANRDRYLHTKAIWLETIADILDKLKKHDADTFGHIQPKDTLSRINNNRRFQPDKPIYKDYFTFSVMDKTDGFSTLHISVGASESFLGCGYHNPDKAVLQNIREAIDYEGQQLQSILNDSSFVAFFGGLSTFSAPLKTNPKGFPKEHPYSSLLRHKNFVIARNLTEADVCAANFSHLVQEAYLLARPFCAFLKKAHSIQS